MMISIILFASTFIIVPIFCAVMLSMGKHKDGKLVGIVLSKEQAADADILNILQKYKKRIWILTCFLCLFPIPSFFVKSFTAVFSLWMLWLYLCIFGYGLLYAVCFLRIRDVKYSRGWNLPEQEEVHMIDLSASVENEKFRYHKIFLLVTGIAIGITILSGIFYNQKLGRTRSIFTMIEIGFITAIFYVCAILLQRVKSPVISQDSTINTNYTRVRNRRWGHGFIWMALMNDAFLVIMFFWLQGKLNAWWILGFSFILTFGMLGIIIFIAMKNEKWKYTFGTWDNTDSYDNEKYWILGSLYYNPSDRKVLVEKRVGIGMTMNMATIPGKLMGIFTALVFLLMPLLCVLIGVEEYTPIRMNYKNHQLIASHVFTSYEINIHDVDHVQLINRLPNRSKLDGNGMPNLETGLYRVDGYGSVKMCLNPQKEKFITLTMDNGKTYIVSTENDQETLRIYSAISNDLN
jgi:hypothetical protein